MVVPKISIIIANYNNGIFFPDCYDSLIKQTSSNWEAIIIDDCSSDNSIECIRSLIKDDVRFRLYINEKNRGYQNTLIKGIELSQTALFARLDPDDALAPRAIEISLKAHYDYPEVGLVYSNFTFCDEDLNPVSVHKGVQINNLDEKYLNFKGEISHFSSFKKDIYLRTTGIDTFIKRAEDKDIYMKMCEVAPVKHIDEDLYLYRVHQQGASSGSNVSRALFWHWVALIKMSERRGINIEDLFVDSFILKIEVNEKLRRIKKSKWARLGHKLGLFKALKNI